MRASPAVPPSASTRATAAPTRLLVLRSVSSRLAAPRSVVGSAGQTVESVWLKCSNTVNGDSEADGFHCAGSAGRCPQGGTYAPTPPAVETHTAPYWEGSDSALPVSAGRERKGIEWSGRPCRPASQPGHASGVIVGQEAYKRDGGVARAIHPFNILASTLESHT